MPIMTALARRDSKIGTACARPPPEGRPLLDKGKPVARRGRKAAGQARGLTAGLPKEGSSPPPENIGVFRPSEGHDGFKWPLATQLRLPCASLRVSFRDPRY